MGTVTIATNTYTIYGDATGATDPISADVYFAGQLGTTAWEAATAENRAKALVTATRIFDKQIWVGTVTDPTTPQELAWPRTGVPACDGIAVGTSEIPERVIFGAYELANAIIIDSTVQTSSGAGSNTKRVLARRKVGDLETEDETEYFTPTNVGANALPRFPAVVQEYIRCFIGGSTRGATVAGGRASEFISWDYGLTGDGTL